eukprot:g5998.t1
MGKDQRRRCAQQCVRVTKWLAIIANVLLTSIGAYGFYLGFHTFNDQQELDLVLVLISFYMAVFGLMGLAGECKARILYGKFGFLSSRLGRGIFYLIIGSLATVQGIQTAFCTEFVGGDMKCPARTCDLNEGTIDNPKCGDRQVCFGNRDDSKASGYCVGGCDGTNGAFDAGSQQQSTVECKGTSWPSYATDPSGNRIAKGKYVPGTDSQQCANYAAGGFQPACKKNGVCNPPCFYVGSQEVGGFAPLYFGETCTPANSQDHGKNFCLPGLQCLPKPGASGSTGQYVCRWHDDSIENQGITSMMKRCCAFVDHEKFTLAAGCVQLIVGFMLVNSYLFVRTGDAGIYHDPVMGGGAPNKAPLMGGGGAAGDATMAAEDGWGGGDDTFAAEPERSSPTYAYGSDEED